MKLSTTIAAALSLAWLFNGAAFAAAEATLEVSGTIMPAACHLDLGLPNGQVDFGVIPSSQINRTGATLLPLKQFKVDVTCAASTKIALRLSDNRSDSTVDYLGVTKGYYGLGLSPGSAKIGRYSMELTDSDGDGQLVWPVYEQSPGNWQNPATMFFIDGVTYGWTPELDLIPRALTHLAVLVELQASIAANQGMTFDETIQLDGSSVVELIYL